MVAGCAGRVDDATYISEICTFMLMQKLSVDVWDDAGSAENNSRSKRVYKLTCRAPLHPSFGLERDDHDCEERSGRY